MIEETTDYMDETYLLDLYAQTDLCNASLQGKWDNVSDMYQKCSWTHTANVQRANGNTALHLAVLQAEWANVQRLMDTLPEAEMSKIVNKYGDTPLHLAASRGLLEKCQLLCNVEKAKCWLSARNNSTETPLFLAALYGHKDVFLYLHSVSNDRSLCTRTSDGNTVLHVTIEREYFGLAYSIIHIYEDLVVKNNQDGASPLHFLANRPSAFRSSTHFQWWKAIIYHTMVIDPAMFIPKIKIEDPKDETVKTHQLPPNYATWKDFFVMVENILKKAFTDRGNQLVPAGNPDLEGQANALRSKYAFPRNYATCLDFLSRSYMYILGQAGFGDEFKRIKDAKERHMWSFLIMEKLLETKVASVPTGGGGRPYDDVENFEEDSGEKLRPTSVNLDKLIPSEITHEEKKAEKQSSTSKTPSDSSSLIALKGVMVELIDKISEAEKKEKQSSTSRTTWDSPILIAAKNGVVELVAKILQVTPLAAQDLTADQKHVLLVAVENRNPKTFKKILEYDSIFQQLVQIADSNGNTVLHYAAMSSGRQPWRIPGAALQMQWEIKWYEYVKEKVPVHFVFRANHLGKLPAAIFNEDHKNLVEEGGKWLKKTANSCSVVAALIATVAFATAIQIPGGSEPGSGLPVLKGQPAFSLFAIASLLSLCFSVTALIMFLAILTSRYQTKDFRRDLPVKLFLGLSSLLVSIASVLLSFCAGHFFEIKDRFGHDVFVIYFVTCLPITLYAAAQFPLYIDLWNAIHIDIPQPTRALDAF